MTALKFLKMFRSGVEAFTFFVFLGVAEGKGGVRLNPDGVVDTKTYPSQQRRKYYTYYMNYFTGEGFYYARNNLEASRTKSICENYDPYYQNETYLESFPCPMAKDPDNFGYCCGESSYEYCCRLQDTTNFRLMVGMTSAAALGVLIGILVCICFYIKAKKKQRLRKKTDAQHMQQMGIAHYGTKETKNFMVRQSDDGYHILTKFKKKKYYSRFWTELHARYQKLAWKFSRDKTMKEVKVTFPEGGWVSLVLVDDLDGSPQMVVSREKAAVKWMNTVFDDICDKLQMEEDEKACGCFSRGNRGSQRRVEPTSESAKKYADEPAKETQKVETKKTVKEEPPSYDSGYDNNDNDNDDEPSKYDPKY